MKSFITALTIAVVIVISSLFYSKYIEKISDYMVAENQKIIACIEQEDYPDAARIAEELEDYLEKRRPALAAIIDHSKLDMIDTYMSQMKKYVQTGQKADSLANCQTLDILMSRMPRDYALKLENIL